MSEMEQKLKDYPIFILFKQQHIPLPESSERRINST